jgi:hypothetical protein
MNEERSDGVESITGSEGDVLRRELERIGKDAELLKDPETMFSFGQMYYEGDGVQQDYEGAATWYRMAAERGNSRAQHNLALMYENGEGVSRDPGEAAKWYQLAAEQGNAASQNNLGTLVERGEGVAQDFITALEWYRRAAEGGDQNGRANCSRLKSRLELEQYRRVVSDVSELLAENQPLIGDAAELPHPKAQILYAIQFVMQDMEEERERANSPALIEKYDKLLPSLSCLLTSVAQNWQVIAPEDKEAVRSLVGLESFPEWALPLKRKYIDEDRATREALDAAVRVLKQRVKIENQS